MIKKIGILTAGGDCPGLNAAIRAITRKAITDFGWEVLGIHDGFEGVILGKCRELKYSDVANILPLGGTILGTSNKASPFDYASGDGEKKDVTDICVKNLKKWNVDCLFCIGGDGTLSIANRFLKYFPNIIGLPKTIDNDLMATDQTFGFDTACSFVTESLDRIHTTAQSHHRAMVIEVMGRYAGWIALCGGMAGGGDIILIPEMPFEWEKVAASIQRRKKLGRHSSIVVVSEGAHAKGEDMTVHKVIKDSPDSIRLGGIGQKVADMIEKETGVESRITVLGHLQRGGSPSYFDRILATSYGAAAAKMAYDGKFGCMAALRGRDIVPVPLAEAIDKLRLVSPDEKLIAAARSMGTSFGT